jgi:hypothetical protein
MTFSCTKGPELNQGTIVCILVDRTNEMFLKPDTATLVTLSGVNTSKWDASRVEISQISDKDINNVYVANINSENAWYGNSSIRDARIQKFKNEVSAFVIKAYHDSIVELNHSIIWKTVVTKLNKIAKSNYKNKVCLVYSDLLENGVLNFYDPNTRCTIFQHPELIKKEFIKMIPIVDYSGIEIHFMFSPSGYEENNLYMAIVGIYKDILESHHALVFIESNVQSN